MLETLTLDRFVVYLNQEFAVRLDSIAVVLVLCEINPLGATRCNGAGREPFSLVFSGPSNPPLNQAIYCLEHEDMGSQEIFLVPVGSDSKGMHYEAIYN